MKKSLVAVAVGALVGLAACGGGGGTPQDKIADSLIKAAKASEMTIDENCVREVIAKISDADAKLVADNIDKLNSGEVDIDTLGVSDAYFDVEAELDSCI